MSTRGIKRKRSERLQRERELKAPAERAPSIERQDQVTPGRIIAMLALVPAAVGALALIMSGFGQPRLIGPGLGLFLLMLGGAGLLFHAFGEKELLFRRLYGLVAALLVACGILFSLLPIRGTMGSLFLPVGAPCLGLGLLFGFSFVRNESEEEIKKLATIGLGGAGALMFLVGFVGGIWDQSFLLGRGVIYLILGLLYVASFISLITPTGREGAKIGYRAGLALGAIGGIMVVIALGKSLPFANIPGFSHFQDLITRFLFTFEINHLFGWVNWLSGQPGAPFLFAYIGLECLLLCALTCSDSQLAALLRRELAAFFYSPIAHIVLLALAIIGGIAFWFFVARVAQFSMSPFSPGIREPVVVYYFFNFFPVFCLILIVPLITMRLVSEESRSGTLEVLLTAPVKETTVVLSKFLAGLRFFLLVWFPWLFYLVAMMIEGEDQFDYRPVLSFAIVLAVTGAGFVAMGVFFSSLSGNQIIAAILSCMGMLVLTAPHFATELLGQDNFWTTILNYASYLNLWGRSAMGSIAPRYMVFHISAAVFWLFLTVKVLESRKWR